MMPFNCSYRNKNERWLASSCIKSLMELELELLEPIIHFLHQTKGFRVPGIHLHGFALASNTCCWQRLLWGLGSMAPCRSDLPPVRKTMRGPRRSLRHGPLPGCLATAVIQRLSNGSSRPRCLKCRELPLACLICCCRTTDCLLLLLPQKQLKLPQ
jgi:hypothetical protein